MLASAKYMYFSFLWRVSLHVTLLNCLFQPETDPLSPHLTRDYLQSLGKEGTWAEAVAVQGSARMLGRDIHIVTSQPVSSAIGYLVNEISAGDDHHHDDPFLMGHIGEQHYISIGPTNPQLSSNYIGRPYHFVEVSNFFPPLFSSPDDNLKTAERDFAKFLRVPDYDRKMIPSDFERRWSNRSAAILI